MSRRQELVVRNDRVKNITLEYLNKYGIIIPHRKLKYISEFGEETPLYPSPITIMTPLALFDETKHVNEYHREFWKARELGKIL